MHKCSSTNQICEDFLKFVLWLKFQRVVVLVRPTSARVFSIKQAGKRLISPIKI